MPSELGDRLAEEAKNEQDNEERLEHYMDDDEEEDEIDEFDDEIEEAYQCDFKKRSPPPCQSTSLLSSLLSSTPVPKQSYSKKDHNTARPIAILSTTKAFPDPLSESLKRNLEWEHSQSSLKKYHQNIKKSTSSDSLTDNFSRW